jgi:hypothetical protein
MKNLTEKCIAHHRALVRLAWIDRNSCRETRTEIRRSLRKLREIGVNGAPIQVFGSLH